MKMTDENGFLTDTDKKFLRGEKEYDSKQGRYGRRRAIRERTREAISDFAFLDEHLENDELEKVVEPKELGDDVELYYDMRGMFQFLYKLTNASLEIHFENVVAQSVATADDRFVDVRLHIIEQQPELATGNAVEKIQEGRFDELTVGEMRSYLQHYRDAAEVTDSADPTLPADYARWRHGTSRVPSKADEIPFEEWRDQQQDGDESSDETDADGGE